MKKPLQHRTALFLLLVYAPLMVALEFTHNHNWRGKSDSETVSTAAGNGHSFSNHSVCSACLFASGHVFDAATLVFGVGFERLAVLVSDLLIPFELSLSRSARAPPSTPLS